ncbi:cache domain-containing protein [Sulfurimonas sp. HSL1-6]|uniref:cache domain-containing protein n=1 Tax=Thiomicrolovo immobilis TaxID=3131935 RepID=UPI0031F8B29D
MKVLRGIRSAALLLFIWTAVNLAAAEPVAYEHKETCDLVAFVQAAADAVAKEGEAVFPAFRQKGGKWFRGDRYVFVWDLKGNRYVYPPDLVHEKRNLIGLEDIGGKPIGRMIVDAAESKAGRGWVHYQWNRPGETAPVWKSTYVMRSTAPSGRVYLVGSGNYKSVMEKAFLVDEVNAAVALLQKEGKAAFKTLRDKKSRFYFHDTYVFVTSASGVELVNPAFPGIEGRNVLTITDIKEKAVAREYIDLAMLKGEGWVSYYWPRPQAPQIPVQKITYVKKVVVEGEPLIVGAGVYE